MQRGIAWLLCTALAFTAGCGSDEDSSGGAGSTGRPDAGQDVAEEAAPDTGLPDAPTDVPLDDGVDVVSEASEDATPDALDDAAPDALDDAAPDVLDDAAPDAPLDALVDASNRPPGQCAQDSDCSGPMAECSMSAPGGICLGCGVDSDCGDPLEFECYNAACRRRCVGDEDCPNGMDCSANLYCKLISCSASCPDPYVCTGGFCRRPECASTTPECPTGMSCGQGDYCVEDSL